MKRAESLKLSTSGENAEKNANYNYKTENRTGTGMCTLPKSLREEECRESELERGKGFCRPQIRIMTFLEDMIRSFQVIGVKVMNTLMRALSVNSSRKPINSDYCRL